MKASRISLPGKSRASFPYGFPSHCVILLDHPTKRHEFLCLGSHSTVHTRLNICMFRGVRGVGVRDDVTAIPASVDLQSRCYCIREALLS
jgi:hypothetical protein